jgi:hypothetical protein
MMSGVPVAHAASGTTGPTGPTGPYGAYVPAPDKTAPRLTKAALKPKKARAKTGTVLTFTLNEPARVAGVVTLKGNGVRTRARRCVARTKKRHGSPCVRRTRVGTLLAARAGRGANRAKLSLRRLAPGDYTLTLTPTDPSGNVGKAKAVAFSVVR